MLAPNASAVAKLNPEYSNYQYDAPYPAMLKLAGSDPEPSVSLFMTVMRDSYEGTPFDQSIGLAGGPFGIVDRYSGGKGEEKVGGSWERTISIFRSTYTFIAEARSRTASGERLLPDAGTTVWFGPHAAHSTCYVPINMAMTSVPEVYRRGFQGTMDKKSAFWAFRYVSNLLHVRFRPMRDVLRRLATNLEWKHAKQLERAVASASARHELTELLTLAASNTVARWWQLADELMVRFADG